MIGETIGNFRIVSRLGRGGMGEVYLAEQQNIGTRVAVKVLLAQISADAEHVQRFFNEARAVSRIQHAGIVKIFDVGFHASGHAYLVMEYLEGEALARRIQRSIRMSPAHIADLGRQIASVLDATHSAGITHRDLKPDNIFIVPDRELASRQRAKVLDFGIAKLTGTLAGNSPRTMGTMGTPAYMAPEQWGDASKVDWRADIYSLGCLVFEMACGRPPFVVTTLAEACGKHLTEIPVAASSLVPGLPAELDELIACMLEKHPEERPQSMDVVVKRFEAIAAIVGPPPPMSLPTPNVHPEHPSSPSGGRHVPVGGGGPSAAGTALGATVGTEFPMPSAGLAPTVGTDPPSTRATGTDPRMPPEAPQARTSRAPMIVGAIVVLGAIGGGVGYLTTRDTPEKTEVVTPGSGSGSGSAVVVVPPVAPPDDGPFVCDAPLAMPGVGSTNAGSVLLRYDAPAMRSSEITSTLRSTWRRTDVGQTQSGDLTLTLTATLRWTGRLGDKLLGILEIKHIALDAESSTTEPGNDPILGAVRWRSDDTTPQPGYDALRTVIDRAISFTITERGRFVSDDLGPMLDYLRSNKVEPHLVELFSRDELFRTLFIELPEDKVKIGDTWRGGELLRPLPSYGQIAAPYEYQVIAISEDGSKVMIESTPPLKLDLTGRIKVISKQTAFQMKTLFDTKQRALMSTQARACARMAIERDGVPITADAVLLATSEATPVSPGGTPKPASESGGTSVPTVPVTQPSPTGTLTSQQINRSINAMRLPLEACLARRLADESARPPPDRVTLTATISEQGIATDVTVSSGDQTLNACVRAVVDRMAFPRPRGGPVTINYPVIFTTRIPKAEDSTAGDPLTPNLPEKPDTGQVTRILATRKRQVAMCGVNQPDLISVTVRLQIDPAGKVTSVSAPVNGAFSTCLTRTLLNLTFQASINGLVREERFALPKQPAQHTKD